MENGIESQNVLLLIVIVFNVVMIEFDVSVKQRTS